MSTGAGPPGLEQLLSPVLEDLRNGPVVVLIAGGAGTGKTTALAAVRDAVHDSGRPTLTRVPPDQSGGDPDAAVVVDDAHLLGPAQLQLLTRLAEEPGRTVVVAAEPRDHDPGLRTLMTALERGRPRVALGPVSVALIRDALSGEGPAPQTADVDAAMAATGGLPFLVAAVAAAAAADPAPTPRDLARIAFHALQDRLRRLEQRDLEALLISTLSTELGAADVAAALGLAGDVAFGLLDRVSGTGLADPSLPEPFRDNVHRAAGRLLGTSRHHALESALLTTQLELTAMTPDLAVRLSEHGFADERLIAPLRARASAQRADPRGRVRTLRAAVDCGAGDLRAELADALALSGQCAEATGLTDELLAAPAPADRAAGARVAAAVAVHDGDCRQAAALFGWLGPYPDAAVGAAAVVALIGTGDAAAATAALAAGHTGPPTAAARSARALAEGVLATLTRPYLVAATALGRAAADATPAVAMPDSAAALATLVALHNGDAARAGSVITRAVAAESSHRHRLLLGWLRMQEGRLNAAAAELAAVTGTGPAPHRRDALWAAALGTAIARRTGDSGALHLQWNAALDILAECAVDLYTLLPLGELLVAGARLRQLPRLDAAAEQARDVLAALGDPPTWTTPLHWAGLQAAMLANDPAAVAPHGQALAAAGARSPFAATLADAGRTWLRVLAGRVDHDDVNDVIAAARGLARVGLGSDATRLAGQAALYAADPKVSAVLLQAARDLKTATGGGDLRTPDPATAAAPSARAPSATLSDREREVAELLLLGMPYRDIGAQLFISAKTVEHHVARIRRRLGAGSRSEMLSMLRTILKAAPVEEG